MTECINCGNSIPKASLMCPYCNAVQEERTVLLQDMPQTMPEHMGQQAVAYAQPMQQGTNAQSGAYAMPAYQNQAEQEPHFQTDTINKQEQPEKQGKLAGAIAFGVAFVVCFILVFLLMNG